MNKFRQLEISSKSEEIIELLFIESDLELESLSN